MATRIKAKNTVASKTHVFGYVSSPFDLNDRNDSPLVGIEAFCNNVSPLEKQRAFLGDQGLELSCLEPVVEGATVPSSLVEMRPVRVNLPSPASIVRAPPIASTVMSPFTPPCFCDPPARAKVTSPWHDRRALTEDGPKAAPVTVRP